jgi:hypothetical protein
MGQNTRRAGRVWSWWIRGQILFALDALDLRKPQDRKSLFHTLESRWHGPRFLCDIADLARFSTRNVLVIFTSLQNPRLTDDLI